MEPDMEDILGMDEESAPPTEAEEIALWQRLFGMDLKGRHIEFANIGGDMHRIDATLERIFPILGGGILAQVSSLTYANEGREEAPIPAPETLILIADWEPPKFSEDGNPQNRTIILPGAFGTILPDGDFVDYGILDIGFIY